MPLPPALAAKLAKRGLLQQPSKPKVSESNSGYVEEVIAESYDDPKSTVTSSSTKPSSKGATLTKFHKLGHYGCPNKSNMYHNCTQYCVSRWGRGKGQPESKYNARRLKMLKKYPLPSNWTEVYDAGTGRYYYWDAKNDVVCWLSPRHPKAVPGKSAADKRAELFEKDQAQAAMPPPMAPKETVLEKLSRSSNSFSSNYKRPDKDRRKRDKDMELDPMDPAAYSDIPRGTWSSGLMVGNEAKTGVDVTATGPLFQMRPYPSPGSIMRANAESKGNSK